MGPTLTAKTLAQQVRHLDEKRPAVASETRNKLGSEWMGTVVVHVVVVSDIERSAGAGGPTGQKTGP